VVRKIFQIRLVCAIAVMAAISVPVAAQEQPTGGPFSGLFSGSPKEQPQTLDVRASAFAAYDDNVLAQAPNGGSGLIGSDPRTIQPGVANGFQASLLYGYHTTGTRSQFNVNGLGSFQQFASSAGGAPLRFQSYNIGSGLRTRITNKVAIAFSGGAAYSPYYQYAPFLKSTTTDESPVGNDYGFAVNSEWIRSSTAAATIEDRFTKKSSISGTLSWVQSDIVSGDGPNLNSRLARATFSHSLTRKLAFHVGYGIEEDRYSLKGVQGPPVRNNLLDIGLGYGDGLTLTFARHYTLNLSVGASVVKNANLGAVAQTQQSTAFLVNGGATLSRSIGRTWGTSIGYLRGVSYMVGFPQPINTDSANAGIAGPLLPRLQFSAGAGASRGSLVFTQSGGALVSYTTSTRLTYALFKNLGLYGQASYYRFSIPSDFTFNGLVPNLNRRTVSVGLSTWIPLIKQRRGALAPGQTPAGQP
jgi:hypothetical protein